MKKVIILTLTNLFVFNLSFSQNASGVDIDDSETRVYLESDIFFSSSTNDTRRDAQAGIGTLGVKFQRKFIYGRILFTVYSKNNEIETESLIENKLFGSSLLIPQNSSNNISNFVFQFGTKSFYKFEKVNQETDFFSWKRFGANLQYGLYNTVWRKGADILPVTISAAELMITYRLLSLRLDGEQNGRLDFYLQGGMSSRRIGGDYGLEVNKELRNNFLGNDKLGFNAFYGGARLVNVVDFFDSLQI